MWTRLRRSWEASAERRADLFSVSEPYERLIFLRMEQKTALILVPRGGASERFISVRASAFCRLLLFGGGGTFWKSALERST